jgi:transcription antitermination factor NusA-like protein
MFATDASSGPVPVHVSIKILLEPGLAGSIIGKGGAAITGLTEISGARIKISNINDCYPGTTDQVLLISGGEDEVDSAQELIWHRVAQHLAWKTRGANGIDTWDPRATLESIRRGDITRGSSVTGRILIPLDACGAVIGTNGSYIRTMSDETGVRIQLSSKGDSVSLATQERTVTIVGDVEDCIQCTANIIKKMQEDSGAAYENKTPSYVLCKLLTKLNSR